MKQSKLQSTRIAIILACIILIVFSVLATVFAVEVISNKSGKTTYEKLGDTEIRMLESLQAYLTENGMTLDKPVAFVKNSGAFRGRAYIFNVGITEHKLNYGLNGGTYATEILLPDEYKLPTMYRCCAFAPDLGSLLFPSDYDKVKLCDKDVYVIAFDEESLSDGNFTTLLDRMFGKE